MKPRGSRYNEAGTFLFRKLSFKPSMYILVAVVILSMLALSPAQDRDNGAGEPRWLHHASAPLLGASAGIPAAKQAPNGQGPPLT